MKNFRDYENLIRDIINKENDKDENWDWGVHSFGKNCVTIRWGYLKYIGEKNYFSINLENLIDTDYNEMFLKSCLPNGKMIDGHIVHETPTPDKCWQESYENGIKSSLNEIFYYAHTRY